MGVQFWSGVSESPIREQVSTAPSQSTPWKTGHLKVPRVFSPAPAQESAVSLSAVLPVLQQHFVVQHAPGVAAPSSLSLLVWSD